MGPEAVGPGGHGLEPLRPSVKINPFLQAALRLSQILSRILTCCLPELTPGIERDAPLPFKRLTLMMLDS